MSYFIVAHKFLPFGWLFRGKSASLILFPTILIALSHVNDYSVFKETKSKPEKTNFTLSFSQFSTVCVIVGVSIVFPSIFYRVTYANFDPNPSIFSTTNKDSVIRSGVLNAHYGFDIDGENNFELISNEIQRRGLNVVALMNSDLARLYNSNWDIVDFLQQKLKMYSDYGPSTLQDLWGKK